LGVKRTFPISALTSANDPNRYQFPRAGGCVYGRVIHHLEGRAFVSKRGYDAVEV
jgi:hypothetical protein